MAFQKSVLGGLTCRTISRTEAGAKPELAVILCHGFGAPGHDLVGLADELFDRFPQLAGRVDFYFPEAPLSLDHLGMPGGRAWWHIDMNELIGAIERGELRILRDRRPAGMTESRAFLLRLIDDVRQQTGLPESRFVLGGFSQGSMLAVEVALHLPAQPAGLCLWSSTLVGESEWQMRADRLRGVPVLQSHGRQDQILPFPAAEWLRDFLIEAGANVEFLPFNGPHTIPFAALVRFGEMLLRLVAAEKLPRPLAD